MQNFWSAGLLTKPLVLFRSYATALKAMITDYKFENNRRYHAYKAGSTH